MKLLVTGGAGFIGSAVVRMAIAEGHHVVNLDALTYAACLDNLSSVANSSAYRFVRADITDAPTLDRVFFEHQPDAVIHLAAESHVDRSIDGPLAFLRTNALGTGTLLEAARGYWNDKGRPAGFRFLHVSTDEVYGALGPSGQFSEQSPYAPNSPYAASKAASDHLVRAWGQTYGLPVLVTNCTNNYGPYQFPEKLVPLVILKALAARRIPVYGTGNQVRDWLHVDDHARALLTVLEHGTTGDSYAIGAGNEISNLELVRMICAILDQRRPRAMRYADQIAFVEDRPGHDFRYSVDASNLREHLGWSPLHGLEDGLRATVDWYLENSDWARSLNRRSGVGQRMGVAV